MQAERSTVTVGKDAAFNLTGGGGHIGKAYMAMAQSYLTPSGR